MGHSGVMSSETRDDKFYFNVRTHEVEQGPRSMAKDRLGPYNTYAEAAQALDRARARAVAWEEEEKAEDEWGAPTGGAPTGIDLDELADEGERSGETRPEG